jgi:hypothetical protein
MRRGRATARAGGAGTRRAGTCVVVYGLDTVLSCSAREWGLRCGYVSPVGYICAAPRVVVTERVYGVATP